MTTPKTAICCTIAWRPMAGTTPEEARAIARTLQARVDGMRCPEASGDDAA